MFHHLNKLIQYRIVTKMLIYGVLLLMIQEFLGFKFLRRDSLFEAYFLICEGVRDAGVCGCHHSDPNELHYHTSTRSHSNVGLLV